MQASVEERLDMGYDYGAVAGPQWRTDIAESGSGFEVRTPYWSDARWRCELGERRINRERLDYLQAFFRARRGRAQAFRAKDWNDYRAEGELLVPTGGPTVQLRRTYASGGEQQVRDITKPVAGTNSFTRNGAAYTPDSLDTSTGVLSLSRDATVNIANVSAGAPAQVTTTAAHNLSTGDEVYVTGSGITALNGEVWVVTVVDSTTVTLDGSDTSGTGGAGESGRLESYVQSTETLAWSGEFDVPARFDVDEFRARFDGADERGGVAYFLFSLPLIEVRQR